MCPAVRVRWVISRQVDSWASSLLLGSLLIRPAVGVCGLGTTEQLSLTDTQWLRLDGTLRAWGLTQGVGMNMGEIRHAK